MLNDTDFMVSSGFHSQTIEAITELYKRADKECESRGCKDWGIGTFQILSEVNQGQMMYCIVAQCWYG